MTISTNASPTEWHCIQDHQRWPGCGFCVGCAQSMVKVYAAARVLNERVAELSHRNAQLVNQLQWQRDNQRADHAELLDELDQQRIRVSAAEADLDTIRRQIEIAGLELDLLGDA